MSYLGRINAQKAHSRCRMHGMASTSLNSNQAAVWTMQKRGREARRELKVSHSAVATRFTGFTGSPWFVMRWLTRCKAYMDTSVAANTRMSGQKLLYRMLTVSLSRPKAVRGVSLQSTHRVSGPCIAEGMAFCIPVLLGKPAEMERPQSCT